MFLFKSLLGKVGKLSKYLPPPIREVLSEPNGQGSYSRVSGMMTVIATICWVTYLVVHNHALPDMAGPAAFLGAGQAQYATNKIVTVLKGDPNSQSAQAPAGAPNANQS